MDKYLCDRKHLSFRIVRPFPQDVTAMLAATRKGVRKSQLIHENALEGDTAGGRRSRGLTRNVLNCRSDSGSTNDVLTNVYLRHRAQTAVTCL